MIFKTAAPAIQRVAQQISVLGKQSEKYNKDVSRHKNKYEVVQKSWCRFCRRKSCTASPWRAGELAEQEVHSAKALKNCLHQMFLKKLNHCSVKEKALFCLITAERMKHKLGINLQILQWNKSAKRGTQGPVVERRLQIRR